MYLTKLKPCRAIANGNLKVQKEKEERGALSQRGLKYQPHDKDIAARVDKLTWCSVK